MRSSTCLICQFRIDVDFPPPLIQLREVSNVRVDFRATLSHLGNCSQMWISNFVKSWRNVAHFDSNDCSLMLSESLTGHVKYGVSLAIFLVQVPRVQFTGYIRSGYAQQHINLVLIFRNILPLLWWGSWQWKYYNHEKFFVFTELTVASSFFVIVVPVD